MKRIAVAFSFALAVTGAYAGAWGDGSFENDDAMDWVNDCVHATSPGVLKVALARVLDADVVEAPDASAAIVAAEVVAASLGKASPAMPVNLKTWLAGQPGAQIAAQAALAQRALTKIEDPRHSELRQLWSEGKANQWLTKVQALRKRIGGKQAGAGHKQSLANDRFYEDCLVKTCPSRWNLRAASNRDARAVPLQS